jgi:Zn-finger nucleic acid-binding protein
VGPVEVDVCGECDGTWFDEGEFGRVHMSLHARNVELAFTPTNIPAGRCPRCVDAVLSAGHVPPTPVGRCPRCRGIWISKPIRTAEERQARYDAVIGVLEVVLAVLEFFA